MVFLFPIKFEQFVHILFQQQHKEELFHPFDLKKKKKNEKMKKKKRKKERKRKKRKKKKESKNKRTLSGRSTFGFPFSNKS